MDTRPNRGASTNCYGYTDTNTPHRPTHTTTCSYSYRHSPTYPDSHSLTCPNPDRQSYADANGYTDGDSYAGAAHHSARSSMGLLLRPRQRGRR